MRDQFIIITQAEIDGKQFQHRLDALGFQTYLFPCIRIEKQKYRKDLTNTLSNIKQYDWLIFTSAHGVESFFEYINGLGINQDLLSSIKIGAVGPATARALQQKGVSVHFMPKHYTTDALAKEIKDIRENRMLLPRADIASDSLITLLEKKGATVTNIPIYKTVYVTDPDPRFEKMVQSGNIVYCTFTSPSCVDGFVRRIQNPDILKRAKSIIALSIGPVTTPALRKNGFKTILTARIHTRKGMIDILQKSHE